MSLSGGKHHYRSLPNRGEKFQGKEEQILNDVKGPEDLHSRLAANWRQQEVSGQVTKNLIQRKNTVKGIDKLSTRSVGGDQAHHDDVEVSPERARGVN